MEAAGIEPLFPLNSNPMMANDFGFYCVKSLELQRLVDSPGVPSSPLESSPSLGDILEKRYLMLFAFLNVKFNCSDRLIPLADAGLVINPFV